MSSGQTVYLWINKAIIVFFLQLHSSSRNYADITNPFIMIDLNIITYQDK